MRLMTMTLSDNQIQPQSLSSNHFINQSGKSKENGSFEFNMYICIDDLHMPFRAQINDKKDDKKKTNKKKGS